jgi:hypothetical protein
MLFQPGTIGRPRALDVDPPQRRPAVDRRALDDLDVGALRLGWTTDDRAA